MNARLAKRQYLNKENRIPSSDKFMMAQSLGKQSLVFHVFVIRISLNDRTQTEIVIPVPKSTWLWLTAHLTNHSSRLDYYKKYLMLSVLGQKMQNKRKVSVMMYEKTRACILRYESLQQTTKKYYYAC